MSSEGADRVTSASLGMAAEEQVRQHRSADAPEGDQESQERSAYGPEEDAAALDEERDGPEPVAPGEASSEEAASGEALSEGGFRLSLEEEPPEEDAPPPPRIVELARAVPGSVILASDPTWRGGDPPPQWAVLGWWNSDEAGEVTGWEDNDNYRPSPWSLGWPQPVDKVDAAAQLAATGYGPMEDVSRALAAAAEVAVVLEDDGTPVLTTVPNGATAVPVFTVPPHPADAEPAEVELPVHRMVSVADLPGVVGERPLLYLSFTAPASVVVELGDVLAGVDGQRAANEANASGPADASVSRRAAQT
ncbi:type VII secretion system-associated protein [Streptomyces sp. WG7]|uniref:type VII secretion system-associated protein n=1 Tax=Streptomyces sp. WG7 TaxID=3417650 RepID=UPI003CFA805C